MISRVMQVVALGVILTMFFTRLDNGQIYVQARVGVLQQVASVMFVGMLNCIAVFPQEYSLYKFEKLENAYDATGFFVAYSLNEIPFGKKNSM